MVRIERDMEIGRLNHHIIINCFFIVAISYDKFKSVHPRTETEENALLVNIECTSSDDSEDGKNLIIWPYSSYF